MKRPAYSKTATVRSAAEQRTKREELKTYKELDLKRDLKSIQQRKKVQANGLRRVLGDGSSAQPYLIVETARYRQVRMEIQRQLLLEAKRNGLDLDVDLLLRQLKPRIEGLVYSQLAEEASHESLSHLPVKALGRALTKEERVQFAATMALSEKSGNSPAKASSRVALNHVLGHIEKRQTHNPERYQTLWAQVVGPEISQQSYFDHVDPATSIAWFRCTNSALSYDLQRRTGLATKLSKALGLPIRQLRAKF